MRWREVFDRTCTEVDWCVQFTHLWEMVLLCSQNSIVVCSRGKSLIFDFGKGCTLRRRTGRSLVDSSAALGQDRLVTPIVQQPFEVLRRPCLQWIHTFSLTTDFSPPWRMSSRVCKMLCLRGKRSMHVGYLFGNSNVTSESQKKFLSVGKEFVLLKRTRLLVRGIFNAIFFTVLKFAMSSCTSFMWCGAFL